MSLIILKGIYADLSYYAELCLRKEFSKSTAKVDLTSVLGLISVLIPTFDATLEGFNVTIPCRRQVMTLLNETTNLEKLLAEDNIPMKCWFIFTVIPPIMNKSSIRNTAIRRIVRNQNERKELLLVIDVITLPL